MSNLDWKYTNPENWGDYSSAINPHSPNLGMPVRTAYTRTVTPKKANFGESFHPVKAGTKTSHVVFILDASTSMLASVSATISGFNEYLAEQRRSAEETNIPTFVSLYTFDGQSVNCLFNRVSVGHVRDLNEETYRVGGMTNLYDAIGGVMMNVNNVLKEQTERDSVIITLLTDGDENVSSTFTNADIKLMMSRSEEQNWGFQFLGANIDAFAVGSTMGFRPETTLQYTMGSITDTVRSASMATTRMKTAYAAGHNTADTYALNGFTAAERMSATKG
jgi:hypothetical protein